MITQQDLNQQLETLIEDAKDLLARSYRLTQGEIDHGLAKLSERINYTREKIEQ